MPSANEVSRRFSQRLKSYEEHALAQKIMAFELVSALELAPLPERLRAFEIGCGSGVLTRSLVERFEIEELTLNDLYDPGDILPQSSVSQRLWIGDAQEIDWPSEQDLIVSNAVFQWFNRPQEILPKARRALRSNGIFAFTAFLPGTFEQFRKITGFGLDYPPSSHWDHWIRSGTWRVLEDVTNEIILRFDHPFHVLQHIRATGVGATGTYRWTQSKIDEFERQYPRQKDGKYPLTFHYRRFVLLSSSHRKES